MWISFSQYTKFQFNIKPYEAVGWNKEGNAKFCCHSKDSEVDSLLVFKLKTVKIQSRHIDVTFTVQKNYSLPSIYMRL